MRRGDGRADRRGDAVRPRAVRPDRGDARRRRGAAARAGRHPRARQRAGPDRVGGLRDRDQGSRGGRRDHDPGHAAQLGAGDDDGRRPGSQALGRRGAGVGGRGVLGRGGARQPRRPGVAARGRGVRLQVLPAGLRRRRVPAPAARRVRDRDGRDGAARRADDRARGGRLAPRRLRAGRRALRGVPGLPPPRGRGGRDRAGPRAGAGDRRTCARRAPVGRGRRPDAAVRPRRGGGRVGRDLPALPDLRRRARARRRHRAEVLPAHPRGRQPRGAVGRAGRGRRRPGGLRPLAVHGVAEGQPRLRAGLGRDLLGAARPAGRVDRGPGARALARRRGAVDGDGPGRPGRADRPRADRRRRPGRPGAVRPGRVRSPWTWPGSSTATPCRRTPAGRSSARYGRPGCAAYRWTTMCPEDNCW